jgi:hypothetical protein
MMKVRVIALAFSLLAALYLAVADEDQAIADLINSMPGLSDSTKLYHPWNISDIPNGKCGWTGVTCQDNSIIWMYVCWSP